MTTRTEPRTEVFTLAWPPSANNSKIPVGKRMVSTKELRSYHKSSFWSIRSFMIKPMEPPYDVTLEFQEPDRRRRDIANLEKAVCDSMVGAGLITDDCRIDRLTLVRGPKFPGGQVIVTIKEIVDGTCNSKQVMV